MRTYYVSLENHLQITKVLDTYNQKENGGTKEMRWILAKTVDRNYSKIVECYIKVNVTGKFQYL